MRRKKTFDGGLSLEETSIRVVEFESIGWVLDDWGIDGDRNRFEFELHPDGGRPAPCVFRAKGAKPLPGFKRVKAGSLLEKGQPVEVELFRWEG